MNAADSSKRVFQFYHASSLFLVALTPLALINPYQSVYVSLPMDMLLGEQWSNWITLHAWNPICLSTVTPLTHYSTGSSSKSINFSYYTGVIFPVHSHIALNYVIGDYVPKASRSIARAGLLGTTIVAAAGILKLNLTGPGLTDVIKSLWRSPKKVEGTL